MQAIAVSGTKMLHDHYWEVKLSQFLSKMWPALWDDLRTPALNMFSCVCGDCFGVLHLLTLTLLLCIAEILA